MTRCKIRVVSKGLADCQDSIVFIHGFNGYPERTWAYKKADTNPPEIDDNSDILQGPLILQSRTHKLCWKRQSSVSKTTYWHRDLLPMNVEETRVLTYGYDTAIHHRLGAPRNQNTV